MMRRLHIAWRDERGLTLPELIVASLLTVIVLVVVGSIYLSTIRVERIVSDLSEGASSAQLVARSIDAGVRNGVHFAPTPVTTAPDGTQLLVVCTADGATSPVYTWQAWVYSPAGTGELRTRTFPDDQLPSIPSATALASWSLLASGIDARGGGGTVFTFDDTVSERRVAVQFSSVGDLTDSATIDFATNLAPAPDDGSEPCS